MKTHNIYIKHTGLFIILLIATIQFSNAQQASLSELLSGSWQFDYDTSYSKLEVTTRTQIDSLPTIKAQLQAVYKNREVSFGSDGTYTVALADGRNHSGSWSIVGNDIVEITDTNGNVFTREVLSINNTQLILVPKDDISKNATLKEWHFIKL